MLIDQYLPKSDAAERHDPIVYASSARVYAALRTADLVARPPSVGALRNEAWREQRYGGDR
jgi:hypothetical protein